MATAKRRPTAGRRGRRRHPPDRMGLDLGRRIAELGPLGPRDRVVLPDGIAAAWAVSLRERAVKVHAAPPGPGDAPRCATIPAFGEGEQVPLVLDGRDCGTPPVRDLLP